MIERDKQPFKCGLVLPGQYLWDDQSLDSMALLIPEFLGLRKRSHPRMFGVFSDPNRDRRHRAISVCYLSVVDHTQMVGLTYQDPRFRIITFDPGGSSHSNLMYQGDPVLEIAFDHRAIINHAFMNMQDTLDHSMIAFDFLAPQFTLFELQRVHEVLLREKLDKALFRKRMLGRKFFNGTRLQRCGEQRATAGRPAAVYRLVREFRKSAPTE
jgi:8-oxo-dGTP diphosphatase